MQARGAMRVHDLRHAVASCDIYRRILQGPRRGVARHGANFDAVSVRARAIARREVWRVAIMNREVARLIGRHPHGVEIIQDHPIAKVEIASRRNGQKASRVGPSRSPGLICVQGRRRATAATSRRERPAAGPARPGALPRRGRGRSYDVPCRGSAGWRCRSIRRGARPRPRPTISPTAR
jgi:hypothetical protein